MGWPSGDGKRRRWRSCGNKRKAAIIRLSLIHIFASLLCETTAETKATLTKLKNMIVFDED